MNLLADRTNHSLKPTNQFIFGKSTKKLSSTMKDSEKCSDPQLWHACAGSMVHIPSVNSKVYYFPQGHAEHSQSQVDFGDSPSFIPSLILSCVTSIKLMADPETDEVFTKIRLLPIRTNVVDFDEDEESAEKLQEKPSSFAKTLTQSDANNGGGFSVPRYCAETIFPKLDYSAEPPVQTVLAKDVHGQIWKFKHIYRGTPRRHLLTTGWSSFVNQKNLVAGDSIVFLREENGDLCVGIRRAKRGGIGGWDPPQFSVFLKEGENNKLNMRGKGRVRSESVLEAARLAASGQPFEVVYYPRASTLEFCVKAAAVRAAMKARWCSGMRFKMAFETEDSSRISWFMGTISSVLVADPFRWPDSPWRLLQVAWDEPDLLQNVKRVNPWLVELVSNMHAFHLAPFTPLRKKLRIPPDPNFPLESHQFLTAPFPKPYQGPKSIQGARHAQYGHTSLSDHHPKNLHSGLFHASFHEDIACLLTIGSPSTNKSESNGNGKKRPQLILFGQTIFTEEQMPLSSGYSSSDRNNEKGANFSSSDGSASASGSHHQSRVESYPSWLKEDHREIELDALEMHHSVLS